MSLFALVALPFDWKLIISKTKPRKIMELLQYGDTASRNNPFHQSAIAIPCRRPCMQTIVFLNQAAGQRKTKSSTT
jgi:hypothetical protein